VHVWKLTVPRTDPFFYYELFIELPKASLKDYYETIKEPISIRVLQKMVTGAMQGSSTGTSEFKSWAALEEKASLLWKNAFQYNQDGSDIFKQAEELRVWLRPLPPSPRNDPANPFVGVLPQPAERS